MMLFNEEELKIIKKAVDEYEENHYESNDIKWQNTIDKLIDKLSGVKE